MSHTQGAVQTNTKILTETFPCQLKVNVVTVNKQYHYIWSEIAKFQCFKNIIKMLCTYIPNYSINHLTSLTIFQKLAVTQHALQ